MIQTTVNKWVDVLQQQQQQHQQYETTTTTILPKVNM